MKAVFFVASLVLTAADSNWPQFRGVDAAGAGSGSPPIEWSGESGKNILWKTEIPGLGHSSPIIWGDRIFVSSAVPEAGESTLKLGLYGDIKPVEGEGPQKFALYCVDRKTGKILWERAAVTEQPKIKRHPKSTHASPTPATASSCPLDRRVCIPTISTASSCGRWIWACSIPAFTWRRMRNGGSPVHPSFTTEW